MYVDTNGLSTTLDDFAYQKRTKGKDSETYEKTFKEEIQAAVNNQGLSNISNNLYNNDGSAKNPVYQDNLAKTNFFVHLYEMEQSKIITKTYKQKQIERKYGYGNFLCLITSILNAYISDGVVTNRFMDREFGNIIRNNLMIDGTLYNMTKFSRQIASALGLDGYYDYSYENNVRIELSEAVFRSSKYKYGIGRFSSYENYYTDIFNFLLLSKDIYYYNKQINFDANHFGLYRNNPYNDYVNPGISNGIGNYVFLKITPLSFKTF